MRRVNAATAFTPSTRTVDASGVSGFDPTRALAIMDAKTNALIFDPHATGLGFFSVSGSVMVLEFDTTSLSASDPILIIWDDSPYAPTAILNKRAALRDIPAPATRQLSLDLSTGAFFAA